MGTSVRLMFLKQTVVMTHISMLDLSLVFFFLGLVSSFHRSHLISRSRFLELVLVVIKVSSRLLPGHHCSFNMGRLV